MTHPLNRLAMLVMNATSDDYEDLEQIYKSISLEFVASAKYDPSDRNSFFWRQSPELIRLTEIADALPLLVNEGLLSVKTEDGEQPLTDLSYIWRGWFKLTPKGRECLRQQ